MKLRTTACTIQAVIYKVAPRGQIVLSCDEVAMLERICDASTKVVIRLLDSAAKRALSTPAPQPCSKLRGDVSEKV